MKKKTNLRDRDDLSTRDIGHFPKVSLSRRFHCIVCGCRTTKQPCQTADFGTVCSTAVFVRTTYPSRCVYFRWSRVHTTSNTAVTVLLSLCENAVKAGVMVNPVSPNYCIPVPNSLVNAVPRYTIHLWILYGGTIFA